MDEWKEEEDLPADCGEGLVEVSCVGDRACWVHGCVRSDGAVFLDAPKRHLRGFRQHGMMSVCQRSMIWN